MSSVNLHKRFVCKIVETGYFAEITASASVKGRSIIPHLAAKVKYYFFVKMHKKMCPRDGDTLLNCEDKRG